MGAFVVQVPIWPIAFWLNNNIQESARETVIPRFLILVVFIEVLFWIARRALMSPQCLNRTHFPVPKSERLCFVFILPFGFIFWERRRDRADQRKVWITCARPLLSLLRKKYPKVAQNFAEQRL
jgi:hypothetical protein